MLGEDAEMLKPCDHPLVVVSDRIAWLNVSVTPVADAVAAAEIVTVALVAFTAVTVVAGEDWIPGPDTIMPTRMDAMAETAVSVVGFVVLLVVQVVCTTGRKPCRPGSMPMTP